MKFRKDLIIIALATFCLTATLFMVTSTKSQTPSGTYDPFLDNNHDGTIDIYDAITFADHFETSGDPTINVNVTNWPSASYDIVEGTLNMSVSDGHGCGGFSIPFVYCEGYSRLSLMIRPTNASIGTNSSVVIYLYGLMWVSDIPPSSRANEILNPNLLNTTIFSGGSFSDPGCFITETKGPYCVLMFCDIGSNLPAYWWVTVDYSIYLRNE